jgi:hypothetical protein
LNPLFELIPNPSLVWYEVKFRYQSSSACGAVSISLPVIRWSVIASFQVPSRASASRPLKIERGPLFGRKKPT